MQVPYRRNEYRKPKPDPYLTPAKFEELKKRLEILKKRRPALAEEVKRLAEMGDFSENAGYQLAKGRLRGLNGRITELEAQIRDALVFTPSGNNRVGLGSRVTLQSGEKTVTYQILGSVETDPTRGVISHNSPLGAALMNKSMGDEISLGAGEKKKIYKIVGIK